jgi:hypothetical protein
MNNTGINFDALIKQIAVLEARMNAEQVKSKYPNPQSAGQQLANLINQEINIMIKNEVNKTELENQRWNMMNDLDWLITGGGWFENDIPLALNREKRKKPTKVKEGLTQEEIDFLKSTLNKQLEELHQDIDYYKYAYDMCQDDESKELFWKLKNRDSALIKKLAEIQRKLKRGLPK